MTKTSVTDGRIEPPGRFAMASHGKRSSNGEITDFSGLEFRQV